MSQNSQTGTKLNEKMGAILWIISGFLFLVLLIARVVFPEYLWLTLGSAAALGISLAALIRENQKALRSRSAAYGFNSLMTILLVIGIVGILNFLSNRHPFKLDLTTNKIHTLSDQTAKLVKGLDKPIKAVFFSKMQEREKFGTLLENYKNLNPKFDLEYVDPDREPTRARTAGIRKYGTLQLMVGTKDNKVEEPTEEKVTNALIKLLKDKNPVLCAVTGHGEKNFNSQEAEGYATVKKALTDQSYEVKDLNIVQEGKIPDTCNAIAILGPTKSFFEPEIKAIQDFLGAGGRAIIGLDLDLKGSEYAPELLKVLESWHVHASPMLIVDPLSRMLGVDSSVAILANYSRDNAITKDFQANCAFPLSQPLTITPGAPAGLNVTWIAQTTPKSWAVSDLKQIQQGQVGFTQGKDKMGPLDVAVVVEGKQKDSKATKNTRMVIFGSSHFATNNYVRFMGNLDFIMNSISWTMEDESLISIRAKDDTPGKVELSQKAGSFVFLLSVIIIPILVAAAGIGIWAMRRRL